MRDGVLNSCPRILGWVPGARVAVAAPGRPRPESSPRSHPAEVIEVSMSCQIGSPSLFPRTTVGEAGQSQATNVDLQDGRGGGQALLAAPLCHSQAPLLLLPFGPLGAPRTCLPTCSSLLPSPLPSPLPFHTHSSLTFRVGHKLTFSGRPPFAILISWAPLQAASSTMILKHSPSFVSFLPCTHQNL